MVSRLRLKVLFCSALAAALLSGCGELVVRDGGPSVPMKLADTPDPVPRWEPRSAYGNRPTYQVAGVTYRVMDDATGYVERGIASWYGQKFHGQFTSSREIYNMYGMSAAHRSLPLPTYVRVTNLENGRSCIVRVNDRGPFHGDRLIDLSFAAASKLGIVAAGTAMVEVRAIDTAEGPEAPRVTEAVVTPQPGFRSEELAADAASATGEGETFATGFTPVEAPVPAPAALTAPAGGAAANTASVAADAALPDAAGAAPAAAVAPAATAVSGDRAEGDAPPKAPSGEPGVKLYVQAGAFASRDNAERLRTRLRDEERLSVFIHETGDAVGRMLYLVRVGPVAAAEAERIMARLRELGLGASRLIREQFLANPAP